MGRHNFDHHQTPKYFRPERSKTAKELTDKMVIGYSCNSKKVSGGGNLTSFEVAAASDKKAAYIHGCTTHHVNYNMSARTLIVANGRATIRNTDNKESKKIQEGAVIFLPKNQSYVIYPDKTTLFQYYIIIDKN